MVVVVTVVVVIVVVAPNIIIVIVIVTAAAVVAVIIVVVFVDKIACPEMQLVMFVSLRNYYCLLYDHHLSFFQDVIHRQVQ